MKFIVDSLPYYEDNCPLGPFCYDVNNPVDCPRKWSKHKATSDENPHECELLIEASTIALMCPKEESNIGNAEDRRCNTCKHFEASDLRSTCAPCFGYSNWEAKDE